MAAIVETPSQLSFNWPLPAKKRTSGLRKNRRARAYCFAWKGDHHRISAELFRQSILDGHLVPDANDRRLAYVSDKYIPIRDDNKRKWTFVLSSISPISLKTSSARLMETVIFNGTANEWRVVLEPGVKLPQDHPFEVVIPNMM